MRKVLLLLTLSLCLFVGLQAQQDIGNFRVDTVAATTTWDSVYIGPPGFIKYVQVINYGASTIMMYAIQNDTSAGHRIYIRAGSNDYSGMGIARDITYIRTKASSGTVLRYVISKW